MNQSNLQKTERKKNILIDWIGHIEIFVKSEFLVNFMWSMHDIFSMKVFEWEWLFDYLIAVLISCI